MNEDELKKLWQQQPVRNPDLSGVQLISTMQNKMSQFRRTLLWRDVRELAACVVVAIIFGYYFFHQSAPMARLGDLIVIGSSLFIAWKLVHARRTTPPAPPGSTIVETLRAELKSVRTQSGLLGSVLRWYLLPLMIGELVFIWGLPIHLRAKISPTLVVLAINASVYWLNKWTRSKQVLPMEAQLESLLHSAETGEPMDESQVARLRPILWGGRNTAEVLKLLVTDADQVKPVEFQVSFWQVALWGEVGFVGMWFFGMLGRTHFNVPRMFTPQHLVWVVPFFLAGLLYSWLLQRWTRRAVGISTLGVHLRKGQNLILWDEIKEIRPLRVLNIRSLWLINGVGERTILPWTGLERQFDLKASVEAFAPANHPIRNHLSLLRTKPSKKSMLTKIITIGIVLGLLGAIVLVGGKDTKTPPIEYSDSVSKMLEEIRVKNHFPALAAAVVVDGKIVATNAVGFRRDGGPETVTVNDTFHLGSVTKSMTSTVAAMLVEEGKLSWTTTIGKSFPELGDKLHPDYRNVTLEQLLAHRGGVPGDPPRDLWAKAWEASGTPAEQRLEFVKGILAGSPEAKPGSKHIYSNQGYAIAGVMLERAAGKSWEDLLRVRLFEPLGMTTAGFGAPATPGKVDQPWGHTSGLFTGIESVPPGPRADNPLAISPAGAVHCSMGDLAKYAAFHMAGERGESKLLKAASFKKLHTSAGDDYALGWVVLTRKWAGGRALMHNGSNTMFYVVVWMAPDRNCAVVVATNTGADAAFEGCDEAAVKLINEYFPK